MKGSSTVRQNLTKESVVKSNRVGTSSASRSNASKSGASVGQQPTRSIQDSVPTPKEIADTFRRWGYLQAQLDDLGRLPPLPHAELDSYSSTTSDRFPSFDNSLAADINHYRSIYCGKIGAEFMHIPYPDRAAWVASQLEASPSPIDRRQVLERILSSEIFERFLHTRYVGAKRFSLEGLAVLIPLLDSILDTAAENGCEVIMLAMAHRGRLTTMAHITNVPPSQLFACFEDVDPRSNLGGGDVKYHRGATGIYTCKSGKTLRTHIASNPSHLEAINPVILGRTRARQQRIHDIDGKRILAVMLHGDAAFAGQGITAETLNFAMLPGFSVGGSVHVIINNLIGFTTTPEALHSSRFASDVAKRLPIPIFHVNGESPDDVVRVGQIATGYRYTFSSSVVIDLIGYRKHGHNEGDDPTMTSPVLYEQISKHSPLYREYAECAGVSETELGTLEEQITSRFAAEHEAAKSQQQRPVLFSLPDYWGRYVGGPYNSSFEVSTATTESALHEIAATILQLPEGFNIHPKLSKVLTDRRSMLHGEKPLDWGCAEAAAFGSLLLDGAPVRLVGQDCGRGTFSHRHTILYDTLTNQRHVPLARLARGQAWFNVHDSMLSEQAAVGYEYGFSRDYPEALVCWEAQFGDFVNGAQIIIDQFITAGEDKWGLLSGLVMLLPHGFEGMGPEHSSARIERFLQLAAEDNIQVCYPSNAAQYFHLLRRQALRKWRKPLVVFTPKSMLRATASSSPQSALLDGGFENVLSDTTPLPEATRLLLCTGKIAHELRAERKRLGETAVAVVTIEQLYPFPEQELRAAFERYPNAEQIVWVQEEPANMGALFYVRPLIKRLCDGRTLTSVKRSASASPATGSHKAHEMEQHSLLHLAFAKY